MSERFFTTGTRPGPTASPHPCTHAGEGTPEPPVTPPQTAAPNPNQDLRPVTTLSPATTTPSHVAAPAGARSVGWTRQTYVRSHPAPARSADRATRHTSAPGGATTISPTPPRARGRGTDSRDVHYPTHTPHEQGERVWKAWPPMLHVYLLVFRPTYFCFFRAQIDSFETALTGLTVVTRDRKLVYYRVRNR